MIDVEGKMVPAWWDDKVCSTEITKVLSIPYLSQSRMQFSKKFPHIGIINGKNINYYLDQNSDGESIAFLFSLNKADNVKQSYQSLQGGIGFCQKPDIGPLPENIVCFTDLDELSRNFPNTIENAQQQSRKLLAKEIAKELSAPLELALAKVL